MKKKQTHKEILKRLELPLDTPETLTCKLCGGVLHQLQVNPYFCFWIHQDKEIEVCKTRNSMFHKPVIATSQTWTYNRVSEVWNEMIVK